MLDNGQVQIDILVLGGAIDVQLIEFEKDLVQLIGGNVVFVISYLQLDECVVALCAKQYTTVVGVVAGVIEEVTQDMCEQVKVGAYCTVGDVYTQTQVIGIGDVVEF